jgi:Transglutaminase-like superfamily
MFGLVLKAYAGLICFDRFIASGNFAALYRKVGKHRVLSASCSAEKVEAICLAVDVACICYPKQVLCLQRSAATVCLLKSHGIAAQLVIGTQQLPFRSHAWVEVDGRVVNDKPYTSETYAVLDRC